MRYPNVSHITIATGQKYSADSFLGEFAWGDPYWSQDEATIAAFNRLTVEWKAAQAAARSAAFDDKDYGHLLGVLRNKQFPPQFAIELAHMRNQFALAPREAPEATKPE